MWGVGSKVIMWGVGALALASSVAWGVHWLREDAQADLLREIETERAERRLTDIEERAERIKVIENETPDELFERACAGGMLPKDLCE